ncbi:MAG: hypothetical protein MK165_11935 [Pirellulaceae bacterium]|nr:hypothetical protein [Pirellulaceae bacterium]
MNIAWVVLLVSLSLLINSYALLKIEELLKRVKAIEAKLTESNDEPAERR